MIRPAKPKRPPDNAANKGGPRDVPNSRMYSELRELDLRAEQYTNRKKAEICDVNQQLDLQTRTLRLHLYNQHHNQSSSDPQTPPAWSFFIYGQFLDQEQTQRNAMAPGFAAEAEKKAATAQKFWTSSMATIQIKIETPDHSVPTEHFQWQRNRHVGQHKESLEIHRIGKEPCLITVTLTRDFAPELMLVSGRLAKALNLKAGTRGHILRKLWMYAKEHSKVDDDDPAHVTADDDLFELFGERRLDMSTLSRKMNAFLSCPVPVQLQHKLVLDGPSPCTALVVDMEVAWSLKPNMLTLPAFLERFDARVLLEEQDRRINECLADFKASHKRYQVLMGFAANPVEYIQKLVAASATEVRDVNGHFYQISAAENFKRAWAQEAAVHMFTKAEGQM